MENKKAMSNVISDWARDLKEQKIMVDENHEVLNRIKVNSFQTGRTLRPRSKRMFR